MSDYLAARVDESFVGDAPESRLEDTGKELLEGASTPSPVRSILRNLEKSMRPPVFPYRPVLGKCFAYLRRRPTTDQDHPAGKQPEMNGSLLASDQIAVSGGVRFTSSSSRFEAAA